MKLSRQQIRDVAKIMGVTTKLIKILPHVDLLDKQPSLLLKNILNAAFSRINLKRGMKVLDLACGQGSISIPLAIKYKVCVDGYDVLPGFIKYALEKSKKRHVTNLCKFKVSDVREIVKKGKKYDSVLWFSPPHLWKTPRETIKQLRNCCKNGGYIIVNDAYLYTGAPDKKYYKTYKTKKITTKEFASFGDSVIRVFDYKGKNWKEDYENDREKIEHAISKTKNNTHKKLLLEYIKSLDDTEERDKQNLGCAIWIIKVKSNSRHVS